ncbi:glycosyltransferase family 2 protein [Glycomyces sp. NPDC048151]|uniref:glycosyltransferase family 2 protein n=1 Tax=Glycomyces sp. NPDC048151 TaxID=3364002 RepID=UPI0037206846
MNPDAPPTGLSAQKLLSRGQTALAASVVGFIAAAIGLDLLTGFGPSPLQWAQGGMFALIVLYLAVIGFKLAMVLGSGRSTAMRFEPGALQTFPDAELPRYTVLVPLYREAAVVPGLVRRLSALDYPEDKLEILLLVEADDGETRTALAAQGLGPAFKTVVIPDTAPKTKPKACNVGLARATGELCVIFDAEDRPDPDQLRKAALAFRVLPDRVVCVQAELQYWNPWTNWLTRCFSAEYATNFSLTLHGMDRHRLAIPLGGTSNHFRIDALRDLGGWDPYNVTEDADLGIRIARRGWDVRMFVSVTEEEANSRLGNWIRQRSRWIKGYLQTWLVHSREPLKLWRELGTRKTLAIHLTLGFSTVTTLINPLMWALTLSYFVFGPQWMEPLFPPAVLYGGMFAMIAGNALMCYALMLGCLKRGLYAAVRAMLTVPLYWGLMSVAAYKALGQLLRPSKRHFWELTEHGLDTSDEVEEEVVHAR